MAAQKKKMVRFSSKNDITILREVLARNPFSMRPKDAGGLWKLVADGYNEQCSEDEHVDARRVRERTQLLLEQFRRDDREQLRKSGTAEEYDEKEQLLQEVVSLADEAPRGDQPTKDRRKEDDDRQAGEMIRRRAMQRQVAHQPPNEKMHHVDEEVAAPAAKKKRVGHQDVLTVLSEKRAAENELRREELAIQRDRLALDERRFELEREERVAILDILKKKI